MKLVVYTWLLLGFISIWRVYFGLLKAYYIHTREDLRERYDKPLDTFMFRALIWSLGGLLTLIFCELIFPTAWYFKIKKDE